MSFIQNPTHFPRPPHPSRSTFPTSKTRKFASSKSARRNRIPSLPTVSHNAKMKDIHLHPRHPIPVAQQGVCIITCSAKKMKSNSKRLLVIATWICAVLFPVSFVTPSGTYWATLFRTDFGVSTSNGNLNISIAPGGFYYWWEAFSERSYKPRDFGSGYDYHASMNSDQRFFPAVLRPREGWPSILVFPIWILVAILLGSVRALGCVQIKPAEQVGAGQPATRSLSNSEGGDKPQPESEGRSR